MIADDPAALPALPVPPARPDSALHVTEERIDDVAIAGDRRSLDGWEALIAALPDSTAGPGLKAKGVAWIGLAREAIAAEDRTGAADSALARAVALHAAVADSARRADPTDRARAMAATIEGTPPAEAALLATDVAALVAHPGAWCIADEIARLEVETAAIGRFAQAMPTQVPCRMTPRIEAARGAAATARAKADECVKPVPPPVVIPPVAPVEPNAEIIEALRGIPSGIHFALNKFTLAPTSVAVCERIAVVLAKYPDVTVKLEGHTDSRGSAEYNRKLSQRRVDAVKAALVKAGVADGRITTGFAGKDKLLTAEKDARELALNRRVDFNYFDAAGLEIEAEKQTEDLQIESGRR
jgi:outer membrane protein OmpA-like peptidoglycan-associated protein